MTPLRKLTALVCSIAALSTAIDLRMVHAGQWLPAIPRTMGSWMGRDVPLPPATLAYMDHPRYQQRVYTDGSGVSVVVSIIAVNGIESFHNPTFCAAGSGFTQTGDKTVPIDSSGAQIRAMGFANGRTRVVMCYWRQTRDGEVSANPLPSWNSVSDVGAVHPNYQLLLGHPSCIVRIYAAVPPSDLHGTVTCQDVMEFSRAVYLQLRQRPATGKAL